jgi:hypothetical protein
MTFLDVYRIYWFSPIARGSPAAVLVFSFVVMVRQLGTQETGNNSNKVTDSDTK